MPRKDGEFRINEEIRVRAVRLVDQEGHMAGIVPSEEALKLARDAELDLVEVSPNADPPVCKILDYGKFKYERKKREHEAKRRQHGGSFKEVRFRIRTDTHDREIKINRARAFLMDGNRVQVTIMFRGREMQHLHLGEEALKRVVKELADVSKVERAQAKMGRRMFLTLMPKPGLGQKQSASGRAKKVEAETGPSGGTAPAGEGGEGR